MKKLTKYWPIIPFTFVLIAIILISGCTAINNPPATDSSTGSSDTYTENDPERVTISSEEFSRITSNFSGFIETTDEPDTSDSGTNEDTSSSDSSSDSVSVSTNTGMSTSEDYNDPTDSPDNPSTSDGNTNSTGTSVKPPVSTSTTTSTNTSTGDGGNSDIETPPDEPQADYHVADKQEYAAIASARSKSSSLLTGLTINGVPCAFDESSNTYIFSISERAVGVSATYTFGGTYNSDELRVVFSKGEIGSDGKLTAKANQTMAMRVYTKSKYYDCNLRISTMPVMSIETENRKPLPTNNDKTTTLYCTITIHNPDADVEPGDEYVASYATVHNRGASSLSYPKKSLKLELQKFVEENGNTVMTERKKRLLGMRDDDDWILDACYADPTMMHNKMAYNLWEEIGGDTNPDAILAGPHCEYVEVIMNGKYHGLFLLVEPVDEKQMGVDKAEDTADGSHGVFIKTTSWTDTKFDKVSSTLKPTKNVWNGFEMKYPENNITAADWDMLNKMLTATANDKADGDHTAFINAAKKYLDKENIVNYWILISVTLARDNAGKNICWSISNLSDPNAKMYINAWDMDNTFGYRYGVPPVKDPATTANYGDAWFKLLRCYLTYNVDGSADYLASRWAELTKANGPCSVSALHARVDREAAYLDSSGAFLREQARWPAGDKHASLPRPLTTEVEYAKEWIEDRIPIVDKIVESYQ